MSWTKRQIIESAFVEAGLAAYAFDLSPEQLIAACRQLDTLMTRWDADGIHLGYAFSANPDNSDPDTDSNIPPWANDAVVMNLAVKVGPSFGKAISPDTKAGAYAGLSSLQMRFAMPDPMQIPAGQYLGQGNLQFYRLPYSLFSLRPDEDPLKIQENGNLTIGE